MNPKGFTLIELTAVILIMGLLAAGAVLSLAHTASNQCSRSLPELLRQADALVRSAARQSGCRQQIIFDLDDQKVFWQTNPAGDKVCLIRLGATDSLAVWTTDREISSGQVTIDYSTGGRTPTYALHLTSSEDSPKWMVIAGFTGKVFTTDDEKEFETILQPPKADSPRSISVDAPESADAN